LVVGLGSPELGHLAEVAVAGLAKALIDAFLKIDLLGREIGGGHESLF
jgi:hypothetical protein